MKVNKHIIPLLLVAMLLGGLPMLLPMSACAQSPVKYVRVDKRDNNIYLFPEFYSLMAKHIKDTTWNYLCYDSRDSIIKTGFPDIEEVRFISLFKSFTDSLHTYKDENGKKQLLPVSSIIRRYDKLGKDKWMSIDYTTNKYTELKEHREEITRTDTIFVIDPVTGKEEMTLYKYYKVSLNN